MRPLHHPRLWAAFSVLWMLFTVWMFLKPLSGPVAGFLDFANSDKLLHMLAFFGIAGWFASWFERRHWIALTICALLYGVLIELAQGAMSYGRHADASDVAADAAGVVLGLLGAQLFGARLLDWLDGILPGTRK